jgi:hypothetical protein
LTSPRLGIKQSDHRTPLSTPRTADPAQAQLPSEQSFKRSNRPQTANASEPSRTCAGEPTAATSARTPATPKLSDPRTVLSTPRTEKPVQFPPGQYFRWSSQQPTASNVVAQPPRAATMSLSKNSSIPLLPDPPQSLPNERSMP